jgi:hypothetical protein
MSVRYRGLVPSSRVNSVYTENVAYGYGDAGSRVSSGQAVTKDANYTPHAVVSGRSGMDLLIGSSDYTALLKLSKLFSIPFDPLVFSNSDLMPKPEGFVPPEYERDYLILCLDILQVFKDILGDGKLWSDALATNQVPGVYMMIPSGMAHGKVNPAFPRFLWFGLLGATSVEHAQQLAVNAPVLKKAIETRMSEISSYIQEVEITIRTLIESALVEQQQQQAAADAAAAQNPTQVDTIGPQTSTEEGPVPGQFVPPQSAVTASASPGSLTQAPSLPQEPELPAAESSPSYLPPEAILLPEPTLPAVLPEEEEKWYDKTENQIVLGLGILAIGYAIYKGSQ